MKVAVATQFKQEVERFKEVLDKSYEIRGIDENENDGLFTAMITLVDSRSRQIEQCFELLEAATGIDPKVKDKHNEAVKVRRAAIYLLNRRFGLSHWKVADMLGYKSHASSKKSCDQMGEIEVDIDTVSIKLAIRRVLDYEKPKANRRDRDIGGRINGQAQEAVGG